MRLFSVVTATLPVLCWATAETDDSFGSVPLPDDPVSAGQSAQSPLSPLGLLGSFLRDPSYHNAEDAELARTGPMKLSVLTLENWKRVLYGPFGLDAQSDQVEDWWVFFIESNATHHCELSPEAYFI